MQAAVQSDFVRVEDYLAAEEASEVRHEYLGGAVYAMAGETRAHNTIALNLAAALRQHLKPPCKVYMGGVRVTFQLRQDDYYYYPDVVITCDPRDKDARVVRYPKLIIEVLSESTERIDRREKFLAYTTIETLEEYVLIGQASPEATIFRRSSDWRAEKVTGGQAELTIDCLRLTLPFIEMYEGI